MKKEFIAILTAALSIGILNAAEAAAAPESTPQAPAAVKNCGKCKKQQAAKRECKKECKKACCTKSECEDCKKEQSAKHECKKCWKRQPPAAEK